MDETPISLKKGLIIFGVLLFLFLGLGLGVIFPPRPFVGEPVIIERGMNAEEIAKVLKNGNVIRSRLLFVWAAYIAGFHDRLAAGKFNFEEPLSAFSVLQKLLERKNEVTIVIPEGYTVRDIAQLLEKQSLQGARDFFEIAKDREGHLFPDTYRFFEDASAVEVLQVLGSNFDRKIKPLEADIAKSGRPLEQIIIMASIVEKEARFKEDKKLVSGILWRRFEEGIPLQADATLWYANGKASKDLTLADLKEPHPFNSYLYPGLPPSPISNPGLESIGAALYPIISDYYYYLSDSEGKIHYAKIFEEHKRNKALYLD